MDFVILKHKEKMIRQKTVNLKVLRSVTWVLPSPFQKGETVKLLIENGRRICKVVTLKNVI